MKKCVLWFVMAMLLGACDKAATEHNFSDPIQTKSATHSPTHQNPHDLTALADELGAEDSTDEVEAEPILMPDGKIKIDQRYLHTGITPADTASYAYPIAIDTQAVKNYATAYHISDKQAQHSMVVSMASPEALGKILDQLRDGKYLAHHLTDGANMRLVITTTSDVVADEFDYVFEGEFGRGLVLPVVIKPTE